ncbi:MAG: hypothetical protein HXS52_01145 [Theionarchaea archaeon]|nr:hypothetical protein [Theionarchaea archaeon]MBU7036510.1 hypothetical protein [Theionarchaea archaeon]
MKIHQEKDVTVIEECEKTIVVSCDSAGAIGYKKHDILQVDPYLVGRITTRVALMELACVGATPLVIVDTLCVEMDPTGERILEGIKEEAKEIAVITGSTEENMKTCQTGVGIMCIGMCDSLRVGKSNQGDLVVAVGIPMVGSDVLGSGEAIADLQDVETLLSLEYIGAILPVGSKGIRKEAVCLGPVKFLDSGLDLDGSCGPSTVVLITIPKERVRDLKNVVKKPITAVAELL